MCVRLNLVLFTMRKWIIINMTETGTQPSRNLGLSVWESSYISKSATRRGEQCCDVIQNLQLEAETEKSYLKLRAWEKL